MNGQLIQTIGIVLGLLLSLPLLVALVRISMFAGALVQGIKGLTERLDGFIARVDVTLSTHDARLLESEGKLMILWDGYERRTGHERRQAL